MARIIAIGGGGFPSGTSPGLDDFLVSQLDGTARRIGYVGTASDDDPTRLRFFHALIAPRVAHASIFPGEPGGDAARRWLARHDMIYVGGGDTARMLGDVDKGDSQIAFELIQRCSLRESGFGSRADDGR